MNRFWKELGIAVTLGWIVPAVLLTAVVSLCGQKSELPTFTEPIMMMEDAPFTEAEPGLLVSVVDDGRVSEMALQEYLSCVLLAEMPASFEDEALKAQAVVARTYTMRAMSGASKHENADLCTDAACCQGYRPVQQYLQQGGMKENVDRICNLIAETQGEVLTYQGDMIEATYFSCSGGRTEDAIAVWGTDIPYLRSVISPGEEQATHYADSVTIDIDDFASKLGLELAEDPAEWFSNVNYTTGGGVATIDICGNTFTGTQLRKMLDLRSTAFSISVEEDVVTIFTHGYGHRVGMSQYGANAMAANGSNYAEILAHYYPGTELTDDVD